MERQDDPQLMPRENWQTRQRGTLEDEYEIYASITRGMGEVPKPFDEWLND
jgi:hypothetical protein